MPPSRQRAAALPCQHDRQIVGAVDVAVLHTAADCPSDGTPVRRTVGRRPPRRVVYGPATRKGYPVFHIKQARHGIGIRPNTSAKAVSTVGRISSTVTARSS